MPLDTGSVFITVLAVGTAVVGFSWSFVLWKGAPTWNWYWVTGNTSLFLGVTLLLEQGRWVEIVSIVASNSLVLFGYLSIEAGLRRFSGLAIRVRAGIVYLVVDLLGLSLFTFIFPFFTGRVILQALLSAAVLANIFWLLLRKIPDERKRHPSLVIALQVTILVVALAQLSRAALSLTETSSSLRLQSSGLVILLVITAVAIVAWTLGFASLGLLRSQYLLEKSVAEKDKMFALLAHDLRGPISGVTILLETIVAGGFPKDQEKDGIETAAVAARNSYNLLETLLEWALAQRGEIRLTPGPLDLNQLLGSATTPLRILADAKKIRLRVQAVPGSQVFGDEKTLMTVIRNLLSNSLKFTPQEGAVSVDSWTQAGRIKIRVTDSGPGLPREFLKEWNKGALFPSSRGTAGELGSGLGLSLCREFVKANKGTLGFVSSDLGTQVTVDLPASSPLRPEERGSPTFSLKSV